ncbi:hypothetical protein AAW51_4125 [Caldimonas brevitalea]|uniref:Uncharacterized protein n=1 Tax=Caldimonas brevitalea TaxID=413882 RepID=A0A0G3BTY3_9BURK|nr:hypothetical protein AAW51_4125 [Caldimonas brevitalea]
MACGGNALQASSRHVRQQVVAHRVGWIDAVVFAPHASLLDLMEWLGWEVSAVSGGTARFW